MILSKSDPDYNLKIDIGWLIGLFVTSLFLWLVGLGNLPLRDWDEGYYGTVAKDMFQTDNWLYLTYYGKPFLLKPPLIIWLLNLSYKIGGVSEFTSRFPCAFLTACGVPLLYLVGRNVFSNRLPAVLSGLVYLTLLPVVRHGRLAMLDGMINAFFVFSILCLLKAHRQPRWAMGVGIGLGLIALSKGILAIALGGIIGIYILVDRQEKLLKNPALWGGLILGFIPVIAWYSLQISHYGEMFIQVHFQQQNFERLSTAVEGNSGSIWYYGIELVKYTFPWLIFLPGSLILAWQKRQQSWARLVLISFGLFLLIISLMGTKLPWYIMPIYPFFALGVGAYLGQLWQEQKPYPQILAFFLLLGSLATLVGGIYLFIEKAEIALLIMAFSLTITLGLSGWKMRQSSQSFISILVVGLYLSLGLFMNSQSWVWELNEAFAVKPVATLIRENTPSGTIVYTSFAYSRTSLDFYSDRQVLAQDKATLRKLSLSPAYLLLDDETWKDLNIPNSQALGTVEGFTLISTANN